MQRILILFLLATFVLPLDAAAAFPEDFDRLRDAQAQEEEQDIEFFRDELPPFPVNTFLPYQEVTRAEFVTEVVRHLHPEGMPACFLALSPSRYSLLFADVPKDAAYGEELCIAMRMGLIRGYGDATFHPDAPINFAEASIILSKAYGLSTDKHVRPRQAWFQPYVDVLQHYGVLPNIHNLSAPVTRADFVSMLSKLA